MKQKRNMGKQTIRLMFTIALMLFIYGGISTVSASSEELWLYNPEKSPRQDGYVEVYEGTVTSGPGWTYDKNNHMLTLNGYSYTGPGTNAYFGDQGIFGICSKGISELTITLSGVNSLTMTNGGWGYGISCSEGSLKIIGSGTLNVMSYPSINGPSCGISADGDVRIEGSCKVYSKGGDGWRTYGILGGRGNIIISGNASVEAVGGNGVDTKGLYTYGNIIIDEKADVKAIGGTSSGDDSPSDDFPSDDSPSNGMSAEEGYIQIGENVTSVIVSGETRAVEGKLENKVEGLGWTDAEGTTGEEIIAAGDHGSDIEKFKKMQFPGKKPAATVTTPPIGKTLTENGSDQELATRGTADGGTMQYALGNSSSTAPSSGWSEAVPTAKDAGTYYVWYKAVGDSKHTDSDAASVTAKINKKEPETEKPGEDPKEEGQNPQIALDSGFRLYNNGDKVTFEWGNVKEADSYVVYANYCGERKCKKIKTVTGTKLSLRKLKGKKIDLSSFVKGYVVALKDGRQIAKTQMAHIVCNNNDTYTNVKRITQPNSTITLQVGSTKKLQPRVSLEKKGKKQLSVKVHHCSRFRYASSKRSVAKVSKRGTITAVAKGTCDVWVYAINGVSKKVKVVVQ